MNCIVVTFNDITFYENIAIANGATYFVMSSLARYLFIFPPQLADEELCEPVNKNKSLQDICLARCEFLFSPLARCWLYQRFIIISQGKSLEYIVR